MKNKQAKQMLLDIGHDKLAILLTDQVIRCMCDNLRRRGTYEANVDFPKIIEKAASKFSKNINVTIVGGLEVLDEGKHCIECEITELNS